MAGLAINMKVVAALLIVAVAVSSEAEAAITCGQVNTKLAQCMSFLRTKGPGAPTPACCGGVKSLNSMANTPADRKAACGCLKQSAGMPGINLNNAAALPGKCGVNVGYPITPNIDCSKVN